MPADNIIQFRQGTASQWVSVNPVLSNGEMGYETDTRRSKTGDGTTAWNSLTYNILNPSGLLAGSGINIVLGSNNSTATVSVSGLNSSYISNFNSSVSGLLPTISNSGDNRVLTSTGSSVGINAESTLVFDGSRLGVNVASPSGALHVIGSGLISSVTGIAPNSLWHLYSATSGDRIFNVEGTNGSLFSVDDNLSGTLMSVNNNAGLPVFEVFSDDRVVGGRFNQNDFVINSSGNIGIGNSGDNSYKLNITGNANVIGTLNISGVPLGEFIDDEVAGLLAAGSGISLNYNDASNILTVSTSGLQPSGNYSVVGHSHLSSDITDFNSSVSGLLPITNLSAGTNISILPSGSIYTIATSGLISGTKTYSIFTAKDNQPPASGFATLDTRNSIAVLDFDAATKESAIFVGIMPDGAILSSGLNINLHWMATTATSGNVVWEASLENSNTDLDTDSFDTIASGIATTNGTSGIVSKTSILLTTIDSITPGDLYRLKVSRDAANGSDTMTGDAELVALEVKGI